jgi:uncharacterized protein
MKRLLFSIIFLFMAFPLLAQENFIKKIEVLGTAEKEIVPDEIFLSISLREYKNRNNSIVSIQTLENQLAKAVKEIGIADDNFQIENIYGNNNWWRKKKEDPEFLASKRYRLKLNELTKVNRLLSMLDPMGIEHMNISEFSHSKIQEYRKELKKEALKSAKEKAQYLVQSIDQNLGEAIEIYEIEAGGPVYPMMELRMANVKMDASDMGAQDIGFRTIKLRADIRAVFRID